MRFSLSHLVGAVALIALTFFLNNLTKKKGIHWQAFSPSLLNANRHAGDVVVFHSAEWDPDSKV